MYINKADRMMPIFATYFMHNAYSCFVLDLEWVFAESYV